MEVQQNDVGEKQSVPVLVLTDTGIQRMAFWLRLLGGCHRHSRFNPLYCMEHVISSLDGTFNYKIIDAQEWPHSPHCAASYTPTDNTIRIRSDVYDAALEGESEALVTIAHEVCHYMQSLALRILSSIPGLRYQTELCTQDSLQMQAHETQTDSITVLLFTDDLFLDKTDEEAIAAYIIAPIGEVVCVLIEELGKWLAHTWQACSATRQRREPCVV